MAEFKKKYKDGRKNNGGNRPGSGRPLSSARQAAVEYGMETILVNEFRHGQMRKVRKSRNEVLMDRLFHMAHNEKSLRATCLLLDLYLGKPTAPKNEARTDQEKRDYARILLETDSILERVNDPTN